MNLIGDTRSDNLLFPKNEEDIKHECDNVTVNIVECNNDALLKKNYLSEFKTESEKAKARENLGISSTEINWGSINGYLQNQKDLYDILIALQNNKVDKEILDGDSAISQIIYHNPEYENIKTLQDALDYILRKDLTITFICNPNIKELGELVTSIVYNWTYNVSNIKYQKFDGELIDNSLRTITIQGEFKNTITKELEVNDGYTVQKSSASLRFYPGIYYGSLNQETINESQIISLSRLLQSSRKTTITVDSNSVGNYIFICIPYSYGEAEFVVNGFSGGFTLLDDNVVIDRYNTQTFTRYRVYRSDNDNLGRTTITIQ